MKKNNTIEYIELQKVRDIIYHEINGIDNVRKVLCSIDKLPVVKLNEGHWIYHNWDCFECSVCHNHISGFYSYDASNYCKDCGTKMEDYYNSIKKD